MRDWTGLTELLTMFRASSTRLRWRQGTTPAASSSGLWWPPSSGRSSRQHLRLCVLLSSVPDPHVFRPSGTISCDTIQFTYIFFKTAFFWKRTLRYQYISCLRHKMFTKLQFVEVWEAALVYPVMLCIFFWRARVCWSLLCFCRPFCIFERCLDSNPESCRSKQARYQLSHPSPYSVMLEANAPVPRSILEATTLQKFNLK